VSEIYIIECSTSKFKTADLTFRASIYVSGRYVVFFILVDAFCDRKRGSFDQLPLGGEGFKDVAQIDNDITNCCGFSESSRCRNAAERRVDAYELGICRSDE